MNQKHAHSLPWSPSPRVPHQTVFVWQWLSGCGWCKICVFLPPCISWVTSVTAGLLQGERRYTRSCLSPLLPSSAADTGPLHQAEFSWDIFRGTFLVERISSLLIHSAPPVFSVSLQWVFMTLWNFERHGEIFCSIVVTFKDEWVDVTV